MKQFFKYMFASALGTFVAVVFLMGVLVFSVAGVIAYSLKTPTEKINPNSVLHINLKGKLIEKEMINNPLSDLFSYNDIRNISLSTLLNSIEKSKKNPNIKGIFIETNGLLCGIASAQELHQRLIDFKKSGKWIIAYGDIMLQNEYYIASVADTLILNPYGKIQLKGLSNQTIYYKNLMEKVGVSMEVAKVGTYKSAVEPYLMDSMSSANREQTYSYLKSLWGAMLKDISISRNIEIDSLNHFADEYQVFSATESYIGKGLIDMLLYRSGVDSLLKVLAGIEQDETLHLVKAEKFPNLQTPPTKAKDKIAVMYATGDIDGTDFNGIKSNDLCKEIEKIKGDSSIKALVLRINSPGGSAYGAEQIWYELSRLKKVKPLVVSMGDRAASGGYYIACNASYIFAQPTTLTGSIGVFVLTPNFYGLTQKVGVSFAHVNTNELADYPNLFRATSDRERVLLQREVENVYNLFIKRCSEGREKDPEIIKVLAEGRVWSGKQAVDAGLVDEIGGLKEAIEKASQLADLETWEVVEYPEKKDFFEAFLQDTKTDVKMALGKWILGEEFSTYQVFHSLGNIQGVQMRVPYGWEVK